MPITAADIQEFRVVEDGHHDFKEQVDLEKAQAKFIDEVIAFLNVGHGHLLIGVKGDKTKFSGWGPDALPEGDIDAYARKIQSIVQDSIDPVPTNIRVLKIEREGGSVVHVEIGEHRMQPYQNKLTGGFWTRLGTKKRIISRNEIGAYFKRMEEHHADLEMLSDKETQLLEESGSVQKNGCVLTVSIIPRDRKTLLGEFHGKIGPSYRFSSGHRRGQPYPRLFMGTRNGVAADYDTSFGIVSRVFVSHDRFVHAYVVHPISSYANCAMTQIAKEDIEIFLNEIEQCLHEGGITGPFMIRLEARHLKRDADLGNLFRDNGPVVVHPSQFFENFPSRDLAAQLIERIETQLQGR